MSPENCRVYVGNLPDDIRKNEVADIFTPYGHVKAIDLKYGRTRNGTAYAFIEFDHPREAEDAVKACDNMPFHNSHLRVEFTGQPKPRRTSPFPNRTAPVRSEHRVIVLGLPRQASWQDLKDHMRSAGNVGYVLIDDRCRGIVEYETEEGKLRALDKLHRSKFSNPFSTVTIKVYTEDQLRDRQDSPTDGRYPANHEISHDDPRGHGRLSRADRSPQRARSRSPQPRSRHPVGDNNVDRIKNSDRRRDNEDRGIIRRPDSNEDRIRGRIENDDRSMRRPDGYDRRDSLEYPAAPPPTDTRAFRKEYRDYPRNNPEQQPQVPYPPHRRDSYNARNNSYRADGYGPRSDSYGPRNDGPRNDAYGARTHGSGAPPRHEYNRRNNDNDTSRDDFRLRDDTRNRDDRRGGEDRRETEDQRKTTIYPHVDESVRAIREQRFGGRNNSNNESESSETKPTRYQRTSRDDEDDIEPNASDDKNSGLDGESELARSHAPETSDRPSRTMSCENSYRAESHGEPRDAPDHTDDDTNYDDLSKKRVVGNTDSDQQQQSCGEKRRRF